MGRVRGRRSRVTRLPVVVLRRYFVREGVRRGVEARVEMVATRRRQTVPKLRRGDRWEVM